MLRVLFTAFAILLELEALSILSQAGIAAGFLAGAWRPKE
jgi:hypothetical protein